MTQFTLIPNHNLIPSITVFEYKNLHPHPLSLISAFVWPPSPTVAIVHGKSLDSSSLAPLSFPASMSSILSEAIRLYCSKRR
ncbi:unnamed protein product [Microthlaspi erraticum]|uniref:Uncharacterized protein n=1 Tax=Microthlaspi erraticum TaxID=1685480 RepID=A0A6D2JXZ3_9BRAS|nr:unnamed protein product [Microthlaspi erraticum]